MDPKPMIIMEMEQVLLLSVENHSPRHSTFLQRRVSWNTSSRRHVEILCRGSLKMCISLVVDRIIRSLQNKNKDKEGRLELRLDE